jgi:hypothetical protein
MTGAEIAEAGADKAEAVLLKERQEQDKKVEDEGKAEWKMLHPIHCTSPSWGA